MELIDSNSFKFISILLFAKPKFPTFLRLFSPATEVMSVLITDAFSPTSIKSINGDKSVMLLSLPLISRYPVIFWYPLAPNSFTSCCDLNSTSPLKVNKLNTSV